MIDIRFAMNTGLFDKGIGERIARMPQAAEETVRTAARAAQAAAQARAPVYAGPANTRAIPGLLKQSIAATHTVKRDRDSFEITVGPRGPRAHLYAQKEEARAGYMAAGRSAAQNAMRTAAAERFGTVWAG